MKDKRIRKSNKGKGSGYTTKKLTVCALLAALGVVIMYLGSLIDVLDISMAVIASLLCVIAVIEYGKGAPWMIFLVTAILSFLLLPNKSPAYFYAVFFGFYPILKEKFEKRSRVVSWILKEITFNVCLAAMVVLTVFLLLDPTKSNLINPLTISIAVVLAEAVFIVYDIALTGLISFYIFNLRKRLKIK